MHHLIRTAVIVLGIIITAFILGAAWKYRYRGEESITVTGLAEKDFTSNLIVWRGNFSQSNPNRREGYQSIKENERMVKAYLVGKGIPDSNIVFSSVDLQRNFDNQFDMNGRMTGNVFRGYTLSESVTVTSSNLAMVERVSREVTELLEQGVEFNSQQPFYYYTQLNELKHDLLANASADALQRATSIAENSNTSISGLKKATMGVFQITGRNTNEDYSYGGVYNITSKEKTASVTVRAEYKLK